MVLAVTAALCGCGDINALDAIVGATAEETADSANSAAQSGMVGGGAEQAKAIAGNVSRNYKSVFTARICVFMVMTNRAC